MIFNVYEKANELVEKGLPLEEAMEIVEIRITKQYLNIQSHDVVVVGMIHNNVFGVDLRENYLKLLEAGLTTPEAIMIYRRRFSDWLAKAKAACISIRLGNGLRDTSIFDIDIC